MRARLLCLREDLALLFFSFIFTYEFSQCLLLLLLQLQPQQQQQLMPQHGGPPPQGPRGPPGEYTAEELKQEMEAKAEGLLQFCCRKQQKQREQQQQQQEKRQHMMLGCRSQHFF